MFEAMIAALIHLAATGECLGADTYPPGRYDVYVQGSEFTYCAIPDIDPTQFEDPRMTEIVIGWEPARDGRPVMVPVVSATARNRI